MVHSFLKHRVEVALGAVTLAATGSPDPPRPADRQNPFREFDATQLGHGPAPVAGLDLEPHTVGQCAHALGAAGITALRGALCGCDHRFVDLVQALPDVGERHSQIT